MAQDFITRTGKALGGAKRVRALLTDGLATLQRLLTGERWAIAFVTGVLAPWLVLWAGYLAPAAYDAVVLPVLYRIVLPGLWLLFAAAAAAAVFRPEEKAVFRDLAMLLLGLAVGLMVVNDWWYFSPWFLMVLLPFVAWRFRWFLWSKNRETVLSVSALVAVILAGALLDLRGGLPMWDNRFSPGLPRWANGLCTFTLLGMLGALLVVWAMRQWRFGHERNRALLANLIGRELRCTKYFDATVKLTPFQPNGARPEPNQQKYRRFLQCVTLSDGADKGECVLPASRPLPPLVDMMWKLGYQASDRSWLAPPVRLLREAVKKLGLPSKALRDLLHEAKARECQAWLSAFLGFAPDGQPPTSGLLAQLINRPLDQEAEDFRRANRRFARYVLLREAQIEAEHYLFHASPTLALSENEPRLLSEIEELSKRFAGARNVRLPPGSPPVPPGDTPDAATLQPDWRRITAEYLALWQENVDRIFLQRADEFTTESANEASGVDFKKLTTTLLVCRRAARALPGTIHEQAADLALALFIAPENLAGPMARVLENRYFDPHRLLPNRPWDGNLTSEDWSEAGMASAAWGLWWGCQGDWRQPHTLFAFSDRLSDQTIQHSAVLSIGVHIKAAAVLQQLRLGQMVFGENPQIDGALLSYLGLDRRTPDAASGDGPCSGGILACAFALHLIRLEEQRNGNR